MATDKPKVVIEVRGHGASWWLRIKVLRRWWKPVWHDPPRSRAGVRMLADRLAKTANSQGFDVEVSNA